jgi:hypothetical protein
VDEALHAHLTANTALAAQVSGRIYWGAAPQGVVVPYIVLKVISAQDHAHMQGAGGLFQYRVQMDCHGKDRPTARAVSRVLRGQINGNQAGELRLIRFDAEREGFAAGAAVEGLFVFSQDYIITWRPNHG